MYVIERKRHTQEGMVIEFLAERHPTLEAARSEVKRFYRFDRDGRHGFATYRIRDVRKLSPFRKRAFGII